MKDDIETLARLKSETEIVQLISRQFQVTQDQIKELRQLSNSLIETISTMIDQINNLKDIMVSSGLADRKKETIN